MLNLVSTTRKQHSQGLKRCGSEGPPTETSGRIHSGQKTGLGRHTPLSRPGGISPGSPCPDACRDHRIRPSYFCLGCLEFHPRDQHAIDTSNPPPPECLEDRLSRLIHEWEALLGDGEGLKAAAIQRIRDRIAGLKAELKAELRDTSNHPTQWTPDLPGGTGSLKAKPLWSLPGLDFTVQAWSKGEATAQFSKRLRARGEKGRFSVSISNPQRVK